VPQPNMATLLTNDSVANHLEYADQAIRGHASREPHAASTGISSSFT
jgi:hypothetical protein